MNERKTECKQMAQQLRKDLENLKNEMEADVIVVGAGISGLAAADSLKSHDASLRVLVLEASDQVGGRTLSCKIGDKAFDLGGQWILHEHKALLQVL